MIQAEKQHSFNHRYKIIKWGPRYQSTIVGSQNPQSGQSCNEIMKAQRIRVKERSMNLEPNAGSPIFSRSGWQQTEGAILRLLAGLPDPSPKCHCCGVQRCELCLCYLGFQFHPNWSTSPLNITLHSSIVAFIKHFKSFHSVVGGHLNTHNIACTSCFIFFNFHMEGITLFLFSFFSHYYFLLWWSLLLIRRALEYLDTEKAMWSYIMKRSIVSTLFWFRINQRGPSPHILNALAIPQLFNTVNK